MFFISIFLFLSLFELFSPPSLLQATTILPESSKTVLSFCCQSLVHKLPLPFVDEVMDKDGLNGLESIENFNMLKIDLCLYYERLGKASGSSDIKALLKKIDNLIDLLSATLCCKEYKAMFAKNSDYKLCKEYLRRVKFYGHAISYIIHRYEMEEIYFHGKL